MTTRPQQLTGRPKELFKSFRNLGLSEAEALAAATDARHAGVVLDTQIGLAFGHLSEAQARKQIAGLAANAPESLEEASRPPQTAAERERAEVDRILARVFSGTGK